MQINDQCICINMIQIWIHVFWHTHILNIRILFRLIHVFTVSVYTYVNIHVKIETLNLYSYGNQNNYDFVLV